MKPVELSETDVQGQIVDAFKKLGYTVWKTQPRGVWRGHRHGTGVDKGIPDLLIGRREWGPVLMPIEVKGTKGVLSPEQKSLYDAGRVYLARSLADAMQAMRDFERRMGFNEVAARVAY